jgi:hypothetical protein
MATAQAIYQYLFPHGFDWNSYCWGWTTACAVVGIWLHISNRAAQRRLKKLEAEHLQKAMEPPF